FGPTAQHRYHQTLTLRIVFPHFLACLIIWTNCSTPISPNTHHMNRFSPLPGMSHCLDQQLNTDITKHSPLESFFPTSWHASLFGPTAQHRYHQTLTTRNVFPNRRARLLLARTS